VPAPFYRGSAILAAADSSREIRRIEILALHLHDDPVQNAVAD
jgi:hypothetical protein